MFLADYGMIWVGEKHDDLVDEDINEPQLTKSGVWMPAASVSQAPVLASNRSRTKVSAETRSIDFDVFVHNITELNFLAGDGVAVVQKTADGARLKVRT